MDSLHFDDRVQLLDGAPLRTTATVYPGALGHVVKVHPPSKYTLSAWATTRFDQSVYLVQVPQRYLCRVS